MDAILDGRRRRVSVLLEPLDLLRLQEEELRSPLEVMAGVLCLRLSTTREHPYVYRHAGGCEIILTGDDCIELLRKNRLILFGHGYAAGVMTTLYPLETLK